MTSSDEIERLSRRAGGGDLAAARRLVSVLEAVTGVQPAWSGVWVRFYNRAKDRERLSGLPDDESITSLTLGPYHRVGESDGGELLADNVRIGYAPANGFWRVKVEYARRAIEVWSAGLILPPGGGPDAAWGDDSFVFKRVEMLSSPNVTFKEADWSRAWSHVSDPRRPEVVVSMLPSLARHAAMAIAAAQRGATSDMEVVAALVEEVHRRGTNSGVRLVRHEQGREPVEFSPAEVARVLKRGIEVRPPPV